MCSRARSAGRCTRWGAAIRHFIVGADRPQDLAVFQAFADRVEYFVGESRRSSHFHFQVRLGYFNYPLSIAAIIC
jgi:hypothetical protein